VGENKAQHEDDDPMAIVHEQLNALATNVEDWSKIVIVYEPVWAVEL
jgi:triosephosphate isomerase